MIRMEMSSSIILLFLAISHFQSVKCQSVFNFPDSSGVVTTTTAAPSTFIQSNTCQCVSPGRCSSTTNGMVDLRIVNSVTGTPTGTTSAVTTIASSGINPIVASQSSCVSGLEMCCTGGYSCGLRYSPFTNAPSVTGNQAPYGSYPWQAVILTTGNLYIGSGVLIDHMHILTVAHRVSAYTSNGISLKVRMGEWDAQNSEIYSTLEYSVSRIFVHSSYSSSSLANNIAILRLSSNVPLGQVPTITMGCLSASQVSNMRCWVSGWGANSFTAGSFQTIQNHVDVPLVDQSTCETQLRTTRLGSGFVLDRTTFMCAGGEPGKDACTGDGGAPLVCPIAGRFYIIGLVAWGIGCGTTSVPGVYVNVTNYISWIQSITTTP